MHIAIIGSGPAGCYTADHLLRLLPTASITILEKLPVPFGLIRYGVAPDHQSTKNVARVLDRVLSRERVHYFGNVEVGQDVTLSELMSLYDAVVLATGASRDRRLGIPGEALTGVIGSGAFVSWYNGYPQSQSPPVSSVESAVVIGNGNVALDVARILAKGDEELAGSDLPQEAQNWLRQHPLQSIHIVGRRGAAEAKFSEHELAEIGSLQRARPLIDKNEDLSRDNAVVKTLRGFAEGPSRKAPVTIEFHFNLVPEAFIGENVLRAVRFRSRSGTVLEISAQLAVTCIGYEARPCCSASPQNGVFTNEEAKVADRLYVVGWAKRGPSGTIPSNRVEAQEVAQRMAKEVQDGGRTGEKGLRQLLQQRNVQHLDYGGWRNIDVAERSQADSQRCRRKFCSTNEMLEAARADQLRPA